MNNGYEEIPPGLVWRMLASIENSLGWMSRDTEDYQEAVEILAEYARCKIGKSKEQQLQEIITHPATEAGRRCDIVKEFHFKPLRNPFHDKE